ncbi:unnamed protein product, partial [Brugia pahangi]|uniref:DDE_Tnp_1_7 domain-containing protein n=1 Tax=Brugia pahangi TaxID=6280 RepID=A0A0N4TAL1_BRUPA
SACGLRVRSGGAERSRISLLIDGWTRCQTKQLFSSPDTSFYQTDCCVKSVVLTFSLLPDAFKKITIFGNDYKMDNDLKTRILLESTNKYVNMYLPTKIRIVIPRCFTWLCFTVSNLNYS